MKTLELDQMKNVSGGSCNDVLGVGTALIVIGLFSTGIGALAAGAVIAFGAGVCYHRGE